jgi:parvulin-like peptidyl-prolyl isomerase
MDLLRYQFASEPAFAKALAAEGSSTAALQAQVTGNLRARQWIEKEIANSLAVTEEECRQHHERNRTEWVQPQRYRASHLFLAAPEGKPPETVEAQRKTIQELAARMAKGEPLAALVAETSEDEATKAISGDLGFFSPARMPPEFIAEVKKLRVGEVSAPFQTSLGFHIVQLTDLKSARELSFEEARPAIEQRLRNNKRVAAVDELAQRLGIPANIGANSH